MHLQRIRSCLVPLLLIVAFPGGAAAGPIECRSHLYGTPTGIRVNSNKPFVPVQVNGTAPRLFLLDTGSTRASVDQRLIAALGLRIGSVETDTGAGDARIRVSTLQPPACEVLAGAALDHATIGAFDLSGISSVEGLTIAGLLGGDFLAQYVVRIDYLRRNLRVYPASFRYTATAKCSRSPSRTGTRSRQRP